MLSRSFPRALSRTISRPFSTTPPRAVAKMTIIGRLGVEPELISTQSGQDLIRYSVGTSRPTQDGNQQTSWWNIASFAEEGSKMREKLLAMPKGTQVYVEGEASMRRFEKEGKTEFALSLVQSKLEVLRRPDSARAATTEEHSSEEPQAATAQG